jgi:DMSO reductase anchor subunit
MSREIIAFGAFAPLAILYAALAVTHTILTRQVRVDMVTRAEDVLLGAVAATGLAGIFCSAMIYRATRRAFWNGTSSAFKFYATAAILGIATTLATFVVGASWVGDGLTRRSVADLVRPLSELLVVVSALKLIAEVAFFRHLRDKQYTDIKRTAVLMTGDLRKYTTGRFATLVVGGVLLPLWNGFGGASPGTVIASLVLVVASELLERTLFFAAVTSRSMPGGL